MFFVGCLLLGLGIGLLNGHTAAWTMIGLGLGFIVEGAVSCGKTVAKRNRSDHSAL